MKTKIVELYILNKKKAEFLALTEDGEVLLRTVSTQKDKVSDWFKLNIPKNIINAN